MIIAGFPCYRRLHTPLVRNMIEQLCAQSDIDMVICGVEPDEYAANREALPHDAKLLYFPVVRGIGCGGDMAAVAQVMLEVSRPGDILMFTDDDINFTDWGEGLSSWLYRWMEHEICCYAYNEDNHFLKQDMSGDKDTMMVVRNKGPVFFIRHEHMLASGNYDPKFHQANDVDIQQRFNILGRSIVTKKLKYKAGTFQEGGMSAFYNVQESRKKYQENTARALYAMKQKYPWLWKSSVSFKASGTSAVYRVDLEILWEYRKEYQQGTIALGPGGLYRPGKPNPLRWHLEDADVESLKKLEEMWNDIPATN